MPAMSGIKAVAESKVNVVNDFNSVAESNEAFLRSVDVSRLHYCYSSNPIFIPSYVR
jgi:hypothetical protein